MTDVIHWLPVVPSAQPNEWRYEGKVCTILAMGFRQGLTIPRAIRLMTWDGRTVEETTGADGRWANVGYRKKQT